MKKTTQLRTMPLISVGIPTYNRPDDLRRTLSEITRQTYQNLDIIVSDNASPGNETEDVVREFMRSDQRIRYFKQTGNIGMHLNFQMVFEKSRGEYFIWSSDDDWHSPEFIENLFSAISVDGSAAMAFCIFDIRNERGQQVENFPDPRAALRLMTGKSPIIRQLRFFMLPEGQAIPHAIYGLLPMKNVKGFSWMEHVREYGEYGGDTLFIFWLLGEGRLALVERQLFGCTVNNQKHYVSVQVRSISKRIDIAIQRMKYLISFIRIAKGWARLALLFVFPLKLAEMYYSMIVREPMRKVMRAFNEREV